MKPIHCFHAHMKPFYPHALTAIWCFTVMQKLHLLNRVKGALHFFKCQNECSRTIIFILFLLMKTWCTDSLIELMKPELPISSRDEKQLPKSVQLQYCFRLHTVPSEAKKRFYTTFYISMQYFTRPVNRL